MAGTMLSGAYQTPQRKTKVRLGEHGSSSTQVGELDDELKEPSPAMKITKNAKDSKIHATRKWVDGEISTKEHTMVHKRANHAIKNAKKLGTHKS